jgi:hypothetical protein
MTEVAESWSDIANRDPSHCISSPDGTGPHVPDDGNCAECGATIDEAQVSLNVYELRLIRDLARENFLAEVRLVDDCGQSRALLDKVDDAFESIGYGR